ncbi:MAG: type II toxin-antitoxin system PemK/MazF family toxin [Candidatus Pacebacteria bacterium]|nr:type II toxin-antitoxin system PemK/MazF family toxin [Candidatus Paceibacterota bacterium]
MEKDFDNWNNLKKLIHKKEVNDEFNFHPGDVWWTTLGINIGKEINGKNETFERPVLILKVINKHTLYVLPLTSKDHFTDKYHRKIDYEDGGCGVVVFSQIRVISSNRLLRKLSKIDRKKLEEIKNLFVLLFR